MTNLDPPITDAEREEARRRILSIGAPGMVSTVVWEGLIRIIVQAMREPAWVPPRHGEFMAGWRDVVASPSTGGTGILHPDWLLEMAQMRWNKSPHKNAVHEIATALMTPPPKPPVDDATLCWREFMAGTSAPIAAKSYRTGSFDNHLTTATRQLFEHTLNWAKNREKRDD